MREAGRVFSAYQEPRWQDPGWGVGGHGIADMAAGGKMMMADQLHKAGDPEAESAHPVRTPAEPDKMADSAAALKARDKEVTKNGGPSSLPPPAQHLSSTQHFFPEFLSQRLSRTLSPWNGRLSIHTSLLVLVAFRGSQG